MNNKHIGSDFDSFLTENNMLQEVTKTAKAKVRRAQVKRLIVQVLKVYLVTLLVLLLVMVYNHVWELL